ncbi:hypothetical protein [Oceanicoccus sp. KOV_DT_Chl]|uniref:hypothetical protein n=1 Tax=Oceanicoccus sp. KOV_DT_Chl TaxID=1904639 RepID=UPI000C7D176F|nr:hypothetical protein [Oceanicoccus sp. KOV_DT_Chl]
MGTTIVRTDDLLTEFSDDKVVVREIEISDLGLFYSWGNFQFLERSTFLVNSLGGKNEESGLYQCDLSEKKCLKFQTDMPAIRRHWFSLYDNKKENLFISHVSNDALYQLDRKGEILVEVGGFRQPGPLQLIDDELLLMETNRAMLLSVDINNNLSTKDFQKFKQGRTQRYPLGYVATEPKGSWWVNILGDRWQHGLIYRYNDEGELIGALSMPEGAEPFLLKKLGSDILVSDYVNKRLYIYDQSGELLGELYSPAMDKVLVAAREHSAFMMNVVYFCIGIAIVLFILGIIVGIKRGDLTAMKKKQE